MRTIYTAQSHILYHKLPFGTWSVLFFVFLPPRNLSFHFPSYWLLSPILKLKILPPSYGQRYQPHIQLLTAEDWATKICLKTLNQTSLSVSASLSHLPVYSLCYLQYKPCIQEFAPFGSWDNLNFYIRKMERKACLCPLFPHYLQEAPRSASSGEQGAEWGWPWNISFHFDDLPAHPICIDRAILCRVAASSTSQLMHPHVHTQPLAHSQFITSNVNPVPQMDQDRNFVIHLDARQFP